MTRNTVFGIICIFACGCDGFGPGLTDFSADFGNGCELYQSSAQVVEISVDKSLDPKNCVPAKVVECGYNVKFVIAKQQKLDAKGTPIHGEYQYWIVDAQQKKRYGPFSVNEFTAKRKELGVPDSIKLRSANSFRK